ncbi:partitioning defective 3 [Caerostris extrusa]|uniref:Partitioning defective 3 n=1 Tax=Caerostris extrusa TaxID=172846 RepID=A0AAV4XQZ9_CAEEX|nr:partitioning defective 3 [Caerostris extrusa]
MNSTSCKQIESENQQIQTAINADQERAQRQHQEHMEQNNNYNVAIVIITILQVNIFHDIHLHFPRNRSNALSPNQNESAMHAQSREERMNALRNEHQKKHKQRNGYYPQEAREEIYEQRLKELVDRTMINRPLPPLPHQQTNTERLSQRGNLESSPKTKNLEIYQEMSKPGSRKGFADPNRYSHYMNFQEIQQHLQHPHKRHYRHTVSSARSRPISELYDFRNINMTNGSFRGVSESGSLPRKMFYNTRQRPPIPSAFMTQQTNDHYAMNAQHPSNIYGQTPRSSGSKV